ncbi:hypothetical protein L873DRAFT_835910 [Choiromyces venosus 120613-1]|uniref:Uncharacterized protein n=1 Tax=Choiromyces venosus 120613-1 TaxID=1336337 RepID=A0A3N4JPH7_9PEZI|nr:hypothetical protein L873DRAFT_835910 [Choiromyces venosus 120613-1]
MSSPWRNWLARSTVNREVGSSSLPGEVNFSGETGRKKLEIPYYLVKFVFTLGSQNKVLLRIFDRIAFPVVFFSYKRMVKVSKTTPMVKYCENPTPKGYCLLKRTRSLSHTFF